MTAREQEIATRVRILKALLGVVTPMADLVIEIERAVKEGLILGSLVEEAMELACAQRHFNLIRDSVMGGMDSAALDEMWVAIEPLRVAALARMDKLRAEMDDGPNTIVPSDWAQHFADRGREASE